MQPKSLSAVRAEMPLNEFGRWGYPDMTVLNAGRRNPPILPDGLFGDAWGLISDVAQGAGSPVDYAAAAYLTICAALIGGKRRVAPYRNHHWSEPCILWAALVGDPSSNKSPPLDVMAKHLEFLERDAAEEHEAALIRWETDSQRAKAERSHWEDAVKAATKDGLGTPSLPETAIAPEPPERRRLLVKDVTPESVAAILAGNPRGLMCYRDELAGWITGFDRYSPGGRTFWLEAFGGRPFTIDRKGGTKPSIRIPYTGVSVCGGIQPARLADAFFKDPDDGLVSRVLWFWPQPIQHTRPTAIADIDRLGRIFRRLDSLTWGTSEDGRDVPVTLPLDDSASTLFDEWAVANERGLEDSAPLYQGFCGKMKGTVLRLALVAQFAAWADSDDSAPPRSISAHWLAEAAGFVDQYAKPSALRVFGDAALPVVERNAAILARYIRRHDMRRVNARDLKRSPHKSHLPTMREGSSLGDALALLCEADWLREAGERRGDSVGRKSSDFEVNPAIYAGANDELA